MQIRSIAHWKFIFWKQSLLSHPNVFAASLGVKSLAGFNIVPVTTECDIANAATVSANKNATYIRDNKIAICNHESEINPYLCWQWIAN